ncbi:MAG TPA: hypothetical protein DCG12_04885 [Planctomycetaceae bacterium]|nr:hypothetical protein [Planctomycetaceae bacterium]
MFTNKADLAPNASGCSRWLLFCGHSHSLYDELQVSTSNFVPQLPRMLTNVDSRRIQLKAEARRVPLSAG